MKKFIDIIVISLIFYCANIFSMRECSEAILICKNDDQKKAQVAIDLLKQLGFNITIIDKFSNNIVSSDIERLLTNNSQLISKSENQKINQKHDIQSANLSSNSIVNNQNKSQVIKKNKIVFIGNLRTIRDYGIDLYFRGFETKIIDEELNDKTLDQYKDYIPINVKLCGYKYPQISDITDLTILICSDSIGPCFQTKENVYLVYYSPATTELNSYASDTINRLITKIKEKK